MLDVQLCIRVIVFNSIFCVKAIDLTKTINWTEKEREGPGLFQSVYFVLRMGDEGKQHTNDRRKGW